ncbi:hypothetical protein EJB05_27447, partial [Eragrostis curvula]
MDPGSGAGGAQGEGGGAGSEAWPATQRASAEEERRLAEITGRPEAEVRAALRRCSGDPATALDLLMEPGLALSLPSSSTPFVLTEPMTSELQLDESGASAGRGVQTMNQTSNAETFGDPSVLVSKASNFRKTVESLGLKHSNEYIDPFKDGYHLVSLFEEDVPVPLDEVALSYAKFCSRRSMALQNKKNHEMCHICFFELGEVSTWDKRGMLRHCKNIHKTEGYTCDKKGCAIRTTTLAEAGLHYHFCHGQRVRDWWFQYLDAPMNARVH